MEGADEVYEECHSRLLEDVSFNSIVLFNHTQGISACDGDQNIQVHKDVL